MRGYFPDDRLYKYSVLHNIWPALAIGRGEMKRDETERDGDRGFRPTLNVGLSCFFSYDEVRVQWKL